MKKFSELTVCVFWVIVCCVNIIYCFNLSPKPNIIVQEPPNHRPKERSSYFGYTIVLRKKR